MSRDIIKHIYFDTNDVACLCNLSAKVNNDCGVFYVLPFLLCSMFYVVVPSVGRFWQPSVRSSLLMVFSWYICRLQVVSFGSCLPCFSLFIIIIAAAHAFYNKLLQEQLDMHCLPQVLGPVSTQQKILQGTFNLIQFTQMEPPLHL